MQYKTSRIERGFSGEYRYKEILNISGFTSGKIFFLDTAQCANSGIGTTVKENSSKSADWESELRVSWKLNEINSFLFGINEDLQTINGDSFSVTKKQFMISAFAQDTVNLFENKFTIVPGLRLDFEPPADERDIAFTLTPKLSLKLNLTDTTVLRLSYGMGYKTPSLKQKFWEFHHSYAPGEGNFILYGNQNLKSEKSQSINFNIEQNVLNLCKINAGCYFNYITDMISSVVTDAISTPQIRTYENISKAVTFGGEISLGTKLDRFESKANYAYTGAMQENKNGWTNMALRIPHRITLDASYLIPAIETKLSVNAQWNSPQLLTAETSSYTPDYFMFSSSVSKTFFDEKLELYFRADNILNNLNFKKGSGGENQKQYYGLNAGTSFSIGGRYKF